MALVKVRIGDVLGGNLVVRSGVGGSAEIRMVRSNGNG